MASYSIAEARDRFSALVEAAERGEQIEITRYGRPVALVVSPDDVARRSPVLTAKDFDELAEWRRSLGVSLPPGESWAQIIREMRDED